MHPAYPMLFCEYLKSSHTLPIGPDASRSEIYDAVKMLSFYWASYCIERGFPPEAVGALFGMDRQFNSHFEAALMSASYMAELWSYPSIEEAIGS